MISPWDVRFEAVGEACVTWVSHWFQQLSPMWINAVCSWLAKGIPAKPSKPCLYWSNALDLKWEVFCHVAYLFQSQQVENWKMTYASLVLASTRFFAGYDCYRPPVKGFKRAENDVKSTMDAMDVRFSIICSRVLLRFPWMWRLESPWRQPRHLGSLRSRKLLTVLT